MTAENEVVVEESFGQGIYTSDLPSAIPTGYLAKASNVVPTGTTFENRFGFQSSSLSFSEEPEFVDDYPGATYLGISDNPNNPIMVWGEKGSNKTYFLRQGSAFDPAKAPNDDAVIVATFASEFRGATIYNGRCYLAIANNVFKITAFNWAAGTVTTTTLPTAPTSIDTEILHFFDRLWVGDGNKLYYTDAPASAGAYPETWSVTDNFISLIGSRGPGRIFKIIPLGTRLFIFTSVGLFSLTVVGPPASWYLKFVDESVRVNTPECAFEKDGLIYYVSTTGVYVTTGYETVQLSGAINNYFLAGNFESTEVNTSKNSNLYRLVYMDAGMILSISKFEVGVGQTKAWYAPEDCRILYSRLDNVAWSQWDYSAYIDVYFNPEEGGIAQIIDQHRIAAVTFVADSLEGYINNTPVNYCMVLHGYREGGSGDSHIVRELQVYDGLVDIWEGHSFDTPGAQQTSSYIVSEIISRYMDFGNPVMFSTLKYAYLNLFFYDDDAFQNLQGGGSILNWRYWWSTDRNQYIYPLNVSDDPQSISFANNEFRMMKVMTGFQARMAQVSFIFSTQGGTTFKVGNLYLINKDERDGPDLIQ